MNIKVVESAEEKEQAFQIRTIVFVNEQNVPPEEELDHYDAGAIHFIGYKDSLPILASRLRFVDNYGKLERICVLEEERGKGYGKQVIEHMEREIIKNGLIKAKLNAQTHAIDFYKRLGYKVISETFLDAGIPHVTMVKNLNKN